jgi:FlaA1/EpsC-like NDP-sugar epimerase
MTAGVSELGYWIPGFHSRRALKFLAVDGLAFLVSLLLAFGFRFDFNLPEECILALPELLLWVVTSKLVIFYCFRQFHILPDYFGIAELRRLALANMYTSLALGMLDWEYVVSYSPPRTTFLVDCLVSFLLLAGVRLALRVRRQKMRVGATKAPRRTRRVGIVGAGEAGATLARELKANPGLGLEPVVFFDDNPRKWNAELYDIMIVGRPELLLGEALKRLNLDEVVISMPSAPAKRIREVVDLLGKVKLKFRTVPSLMELALGRLQVSQLRSVEVEDLLGRPPVELATDDIRRLIQGKTVFVTGAGGSIGSELCRQISKFDPARLVLIERSEVSMFVIEQELIQSRPKCQIHPKVTDILDRPRLQRLFEEFRPSIVFHAAAHKHVPMMESQPAEAIRNNSIGTVVLAETALEFEVERFVLISTDKAINPTNVMGTTKRLAEVFLQSLYSENSTKTRFMAVRFGNVLGSSGSVIPIFKKQIAAGGPVKVTHPEMTRYFMTIPEAVGLVLQSAVQGQGGEIFVLDMGKPVKIADLARQMIELSGFQPETDIAIEYVGLRPGEKLFEELNLGAEICTSTEHSKIMRLRADAQPLVVVRGILEELKSKLYCSTPNELKKLLKQAVPEYTPKLTDEP